MLSSSEKKIISMSIHALRRRIAAARGDVQSEPAYGVLYLDIVEYLNSITSKIKHDHEKRIRDYGS